MITKMKNSNRCYRVGAETLSRERPNSPAAKTYMWSRGKAAAAPLRLSYRCLAGLLLLVSSLFLFLVLCSIILAHIDDLTLILQLCICSPWMKWFYFENSNWPKFKDSLVLRKLSLSLNYSYFSYFFQMPFESFLVCS